jgi:hypothetical protein
MVFIAGKFLHGEGPKDFETEQEWIRTFFESATKIIDSYADELVFDRRVALPDDRR